MILANLTGFSLMVIIYDDALEKVVYNEKLTVGKQITPEFTSYMDGKMQVIEENEIITFHEDSDQDRAFQVLKGQPCELESILDSGYSLVVQHIDDEVSRFSE
jgi:hypothetical protein